MNRSNAIVLSLLAVVSVATAGVMNVGHLTGTRDSSHDARAAAAAASRIIGAGYSADARLRADVAALEQFKPGYAFWEHVFTIPDGSIVFGSARDGRRLAVIRASERKRRDEIARRLEAEAGPVLHNETRGTFAAPGLETYGMLLGEWGAIYERFGVPAEIGLAQALIESGFIGTRRSEADAVGLCQFLAGNWRTLDRFDPAVIEIENQTTQAAYCAAYVSILATKYGSFIPALSAHHAGGTNVGRVLVNGERLGGRDAREQYFLGSELALSLRHVSEGGYKEIYGSYGPRSYRYAEMIFGNAARMRDAITGTPQREIFAMRTTLALTLDEIVTRSGLPAGVVRLYNPALSKKVPAGATLYLPKHVEAFGRDVAFWRQPAAPAYAAVLDEFLSLDAPPEEWDSPAFARVLRGFERRFRETGTEEGIVMATALAYVRAEGAGPRGDILADFRSSGEIRNLFEQGVRAAEAAAE